MAKQQFEETYERKELTDAPAGVVTASMAIRHWNKANPGWKVVQLSKFTMNHEDRTVTLKVTALSVDRVTPCPSHTCDCAENAKLEAVIVELRAQIDDLKGSIAVGEFAEVDKMPAGLKVPSESPNAAGRGDRAKEITIGGEPIKFNKTLGIDPAKPGESISVASVINKATQLIAAVEGEIEETPNEVLDEQRPIDIAEYVNDEETCVSDNVIDDEPASVPGLLKQLRLSHTEAINGNDPALYEVQLDASASRDFLSVSKKLGLGTDGCFYLAGSPVALDAPVTQIVKLEDAKDEASEEK